MDIQSTNFTSIKSVSNNTWCYKPVNDELKNPFDIYPNPTSNSIIAKGTASNNGYIQLDDTFGKTLYKGSIKKGSYNILIDLSDYANGVYFLKVSFKDSRIVRKVLKQ